MNEQFGPIYYQLPSDVENPSNFTYKRFYQRLTDGELVFRLHDGTEQLLADIISSGGSVGGAANVGWTNNNTQMAVTTAYQIITGPAATTYQSTSEFVQNNPNTLEIKYIGSNNAILKVEFNDTHVGAGTSVLDLAIFKNGVIITDSDFPAPVNVARNLGQSRTIEFSANTNDVFDIRVLASGAINVTFKAVALIITKLKQN